MSTRPVPWVLSLVLCSSACTDHTYVIGALCTAVASCPDSAGSAGAGGTGGAGGGSSGGSSGLGGTTALPPGNLQLDLTGSGVQRLPQPLLGEQPSHFLIAEDATASAWPARLGSGFDVLTAGSLEVSQPAPFADPGGVLCHPGAVTFTGDSSWADTSPGALALEVVFRGEPSAVLLSQRDADASLELFLDPEGRLNLQLDSGDDRVVASSQALVADAWHHCLALFDAAQGFAQVFCNGQAGAAVTITAGFSVGSVETAATLGGTARACWAELGRWQAPTWGPRGAWTDLARERFARLVGTYAEGASEPLPFAEVRASGAYVDMAPSDAPELRRLHPVGEHWPRIVCRPTPASERTCGLLVEAASSQPVAPAAFTLDNWDAFELSLAAQGASGPTGAATLFAVTPSNQTAQHALERSVTFGQGPAVLSVFARAASARLVRLEVVGVAGATFDLTGLSVSDEVDTLLTSVEPWGEGLLRLSYSFDVDPGPGRLRLAVLGDDSAPVFAGDGSVAAHLGDVELRFRSFSTPLPTFGAIQQADHLVYPAGNGNLPGGSWFSFSAELWLPDAPLLADAAVFNANFSTQFDQQINLYVTPQNGTLQFWGLQGDATHWNFSNPASVTDGALHQVVALVGPDGASLSVDGQASSEPAGQYDLAALDRIEIGTSTSSSGPLTGLVRRIRIAPQPE